MIRIRSIAAFALASALTLTAPVFAEEHSIYGASFQDARFGGSVYVLAGGGPHDFSARSLFAVLFGDGATAEEAKLVRLFGVPVFERYVKTFDFVIDDSLKLLGASGTALPHGPVPNPKNGAALAATLYSDGVDPDAGFNVEYMLDRLMTHAVHVRVMNDIDANDGARGRGSQSDVRPLSMRGAAQDAAREPHNEPIRRRSTI